MGSDYHESLAYYEGALEAAFKECTELEFALYGSSYPHIFLWQRLKQWERLLKQLREQGWGEEKEE